MCAHPLSATHSRAHAARLRDLEALVGSTPLLEIFCRVRGRELSIFAKHESLNFTGSIKDRMALRILQEAYADGSLHPGDTIVEATSGNTGIAFVALGRALGHPVKIFMPDWMSCERKQLIRSYGGEIVLVSKEQGGFVGSIAMAESYAAETPHTFLPRQFENAANARAHRDGMVHQCGIEMNPRGEHGAGAGVHGDRGSRSEVDLDQTVESEGEPMADLSCAVDECGGGEVAVRGHDVSL